MFISGCASRGYDTLFEEVPQLFPEFKAENYVKKETPQNIIYVEKTLPEKEKSKEEFYSEEYEKRKKVKSYSYYVPKDQIPAPVDNKLFNNFSRIKTTGNKKIKAILIK